MLPSTPLIITPNTWIISDTHFFHEKIGRYCNRPDKWQELIIRNWNDLIAPHETVLHLGDFALGKKSNFTLLTGILNGRLFLIQGNHDRLSQSFCETHGVTLIKEPIRIELDEQQKLIYSHRPVVPLEDGWTNLHGLTQQSTAIGRLGTRTQPYQYERGSQRVSSLALGGDFKRQSIRPTTMGRPFLPV